MQWNAVDAIVTPSYPLWHVPPPPLPAETPSAHHLAASCRPYSQLWQLYTVVLLINTLCKNALYHDQNQTNILEKCRVFVGRAWALLLHKLGLCLYDACMLYGMAKQLSLHGCNNDNVDITIMIDLCLVLFPSPLTCIHPKQSVWKLMPDSRFFFRFWPHNYSQLLS